MPLNINPLILDLVYENNSVDEFFEIRESLEECFQSNTVKIKVYGIRLRINFSNQDDYNLAKLLFPCLKEVRLSDTNYRKYLAL